MALQDAAINCHEISFGPKITHAASYQILSEVMQLDKKAIVTVYPLESSIAENMLLREHEMLSCKDCSGYHLGPYSKTSDFNLLDCSPASGPQSHCTELYVIPILTANSSFTSFFDRILPVASAKHTHSMCW